MQEHHLLTGAAGAGADGAERITTILARYGLGTTALTGHPDALYERHLMFDNAVGLPAVGPRERFEAFAGSVRDLLSNRWLHTKQTYEQKNPKRVYYLSMEFLIGRSLANNITNLLLDPLVTQAEKDGLDWFSILDQKPDAGLGNGGLGRLAACYLDSMATMHLPAMGYGLRYEYGIFKQSIQMAGRRSGPTTGCSGPIPGRSCASTTRSRSSSTAPTSCAAAACARSRAAPPP